MEWWVLLIMVLALVAGVGVGVQRVRQHQLTARQDRWRELEHRYHRVTLDADRYERSPGDALAAPGWLDRSHPAVRGFAGTLKRAERDRAELERGVPRAPGRAGRTAITAGSRPASSLAPGDEDVAELERIVERVEDAYRDADRAVRSTGWSRPDTLQVPHAQFLLDPRWGRPALVPRSVALPPAPGTPGAGTARVRSAGLERAVKEFLDASYPLRQQTAVKLLRDRAGGAAHRVQKSLELLVARGRYTVDAHGFLWPGSTVVEHWGVHRTFGRDADLGVDDIAPVEVANALWILAPEDRGVPDTELVTEARSFLGLGPGMAEGLTASLNEGIARGLQALPAGVRKAVDDVAPQGIRLPSPGTRIEHLLAAGLHEGLVTGRLQRQSDGLVRRLRQSWPATYRR